MSGYIECRLWDPHSLSTVTHCYALFLPVSQTVHLGCMSCLTAKEFGVIAGGDERKLKSPSIVDSKVLCLLEVTLLFWFFCVFFFYPSPDFSLFVG